MKKSILILATAFTFSAFFTSCRETTTTEERNDVEMTDDVTDDVNDDVDNVENDLERAVDDVGNTIEEGANEVQENTGTGGTDDI